MFNHLLFMTKFPSIKITYLNLKSFSRLLSKAFDSELSFVSRQTMHQYHLRKSYLQFTEYLQQWGFAYPLKKSEKQNEKLEVLIADDFNLRSIGCR